jgi:hypothetical protein
VSVSNFHAVTLAATETRDTAAVSVSNFHAVTLAATEARDTAAISASNFHTATLAATEARDTAAFSAQRIISLDADAGTFTLTGNDAELLRIRTLPADFGSYTVTGEDAGLIYDRVIQAERGTYTYTGVPALIYHTIFFYADSEIVYVPAEVKTIVMGSQNLLDEGVSVPAESRLVVMSYEERAVWVPPQVRVEPLEQAEQHVEDHEGPRVADVGVVVDRGAADIHRHPAVLARLERPLFTRQGVVEHERHGLRFLAAEGVGPI